MRNFRTGGLKHLLVAIVAFGAVAAWAVSVRAQPALISATSWQGAYVGVHLGMGVDTSQASNNWTWTNNYPTGSLVGIGGGPLTALTAPLTTVTPFTNRFNYSSVGLLGGPQAGYNWQFGSLVVGLEGDFSGTTERSKQSYSTQPVTSIFPPLPNFFFVPGSTQGWTSQESINWLSTWRARVGLAHDNSFLYLTGGAALGNISDKYSLFSSPGISGANGVPIGTGAQWGLPGGIAGGTTNTTKLGWTAGAGIETTALDSLLGLGPQWSTKLEYLYVDLGSVNAAINTPLVSLCANTCATVATGSTRFTASTHVTDHIIRMGLNYKF